MLQVPIVLHMNISKLIAPDIFPVSWAPVEIAVGFSVTEELTLVKNSSEKAAHPPSSLQGDIYVAEGCSECNPACCVLDQVCGAHYVGCT